MGKTIKDIVLVASIILVMLFAAGCGRNEDNGDESTSASNHHSAGAKSTPKSGSNKTSQPKASLEPKESVQPGETEEPSDNNEIDNRVVGIWTATEYSMGAVLVTDFKEDGTFEQYLSISNSISNYASVTVGKYRIKDGNVTYYDQFYSDATGYWKDSYIPGFQELGPLIEKANRPAEDRTESITIKDDDHIILGEALECERSKD